MRFLARATCKFKGHMWRIPGLTPDPNATGGIYVVHLRCLRCGVYRKEQRQAVAFMPKEQ